MTAWLAGMEITADRLNDFTATEVSSGTVDSTGWVTSSFVGRKVSGVTFVELFVNRTGANILEGATNSGNIADTDMTTLPSGWRPQETINALYGTGTVDGEVQITSGGLITLRTISGAGAAGPTGLSSGSNVRVTTSWVSENG